MMAHHVDNAQVNAAAVQTAQDKLLGYPRAGTHVGRGRHVTMPGSWDGQGEAPPGWTATQAIVEQHPVRAEWAVELHADLSGELTRSGARLTAAERGRLNAAIATAQELPADWRPAPGGPGASTARRDRT